MITRLYIGNLNFAITEAGLQEMVGRMTSLPPAHIDRAEVIRDRDTGRSRGFGFVELANSEAAQRAMSELDGIEVMGRTLKVQIAKPRSPMRSRA
ncbi:MAG: RNA-binding protein [Candidatus Binataceae bacterium]|nr:RNA-binding protein [Candidatus Binataceae bacterium]